MNQFEYTKMVAKHLDEKMSILNVVASGAVLCVFSEKLADASTAETYATGKQQPMMLPNLFPNREFEFIQTVWKKIDKHQEKQVLEDVAIIKSVYPEFEANVKKLIDISRGGKPVINRPSIFDNLYQDMHPGDED